MELSQFKTVEQLAAAIKSLDMVTSVPWTDYTATSTRVGWSGFTTAQIKYKKIGKLVFVQFELRGTSDDTIATMTLPYSQEGITSINELIRIKNDGTWGTGFASFPNGSSTVTFYSNTGGAAWHVSAADKWVIGEFWYES